MSKVKYDQFWEWVDNIKSPFKMTEIIMERDKSAIKGQDTFKKWKERKESAKA